MNISELKIVIQNKNVEIINQTRRIKLLEEKLTKVRRLFFNLKHADLMIQVK
jgi:hypothetical protein